MGMYGQKSVECANLEGGDRCDTWCEHSSRGCALILSAFVTSPVKANLVTLHEAGVPQGTLSDGGASVTFLGYTSPLTLDNVSPFYRRHHNGEPGRPSYLNANRKYLVWHHVRGQ